MGDVKTRLVTRGITEGQLVDAGRIFSERTNSGDVPLVLVPERSAVSMTMRIPSGVFCLLHRFGAYHSAIDPGFHCWLPPWYRVAYVVSQHSVNYNAPVKNCPTKDNVMVEIDLTLVFHIGPDEEAAKRFVYNLGAHRFDELLFAATEEAIRSLVRNYEHTEIYDLRGAKASDMLRHLEEKFQGFGVQFESATITETKLPTNLHQTLQATTEFKIKLEEQAKRQENAVKQVQQEADKTLADIERGNERKVQDSKAAKHRALIAREENILAAQSEKEVATRAVRQEISTKLIRAKAELEATKADVERENAKALKQADAVGESGRTEIDQECKNRITAAEAQVEAAEARANAKILEADAEEQAASALAEQRKLDLDLRKARALGQIAGNRSLIVSGDAGEDIIRDLLASS